MSNFFDTLIIKHISVLIVNLKERIGRMHLVVERETGKNMNSLGSYFLCSLNAFILKTSYPGSRTVISIRLAVWESVNVGIWQR